MKADIDAYRASKGLAPQPTPGVSPTPVGGGSIQSDLAAYRASKTAAPAAPSPTPETPATPPGQAPDYLGAIGNFIAPSAIAAVKKLGQGELPSLREVAGSALEIGSFLVPAGAIVKGGSMGLKALRGLSLAKKAGIGAITGGASGALSEAGHAVGEEGTTAGDVLSRTLTGGAVGAVGGGALPLGGALAVGAAKKVIPAGSIAARGVTNLAKNATGKAVGPLEEEIAIRALPEPQKALRRAGFDERSTKLVTEATPATKQGYKEMIEILEKASVDPRYRTQPKQVIGKSFLQRVDTIQQDSKKAAAEISNIAKQPKKVDITGAIDAFNKRLEERGIGTEIVVNAQGRPIVKYVSRGNIPSSETKYYKDILKEIEMVTNGEHVISNTKAHQLRQRLFATLEAEARKGAQPGVRPFSDKVDQDVNLFRGELSKALGTKYQAAAKRYAENEKVLRDVAKYAGVPNDWEKISSKDLKFGEVLLRTLGNASDKPLALLTDAENLAKLRGGKFKDNILDLADFADSLEDLYGITKTRGFEGGIARGVQQGAGVEAPASATQAVLRTIQAAFKTTNQDRIDALKKLLKVK